ncbi:MAG: response regulator [Nitrospira sp.]|nr:response regulator [bacterium]MBL7048545.1 response regulator [Nitrospira sp.]
MIDKGSRIMVVDDDPYVLDAVSGVLTANGYSVLSYNHPEESLAQLKVDSVDLVLTDIRMPKVSGLELLERIHRIDRHLPVILMTAYADLDVAVDAISRGAFDFIIKPYHPEYLLHSVGKALQHKNYLKLKENYKLYLEDMVTKRTRELETSKMEADSLTDELIGKLTSVAEFRDTEAGVHVKRIGIFAGMIAGKMGLPAAFVNNITKASPLHDIGKLGITDYILFKLGPLTPEELEVIKTHTTQGERILRGSSSAIMKFAQSIALSHHERWDGTGYPSGLKGVEIPLEGRIVNIVDQYDALRSERPYKSAFSHKEVLNIISVGDGRTMPSHFDPEVLEVFMAAESEFAEVIKSESV